MYLPIFSPVLLQAHCPFSLKLHFFGSMTWSGCHGNVWWLQPSTALAKATHGIPRAKCPSHTWASFHLILLRDLMSWPLPSAHCPWLQPLSAAPDLFSLFGSSSLLILDSEAFPLALFWSHPPGWVLTLSTLVYSQGPHFPFLLMPHKLYLQHSLLFCSGAGYPITYQILVVA